MVKQIIFQDVSYAYNVGTPLEYQVLKQINVSIPTGKVTAIVGHTGSGKSTLIQHLNVLLRPTAGQVTLGDYTITSEQDSQSLKDLRKQVGVVFQFPEAQLFEETVLKDVMFGPLNFGASPEEAEEVARHMLLEVGIHESLFQRSPFDLSGGQMRRVAIAGVLALEPSVLVLDEPTAGLDPMGHHQMMELFMRLQAEQDLTLVLVTHQMEDVANYADYVIVMDQGQIHKVGSPKEVFADTAWLKEHHLTLPKSMDFLERLLEESGISYPVTEAPLNVEELADILLAMQADLKGGMGDV